jgi:hypothetical protein
MLLTTYRANHCVSEAFRECTGIEGVDVGAGSWQRVKCGLAKWMCIWRDAVASSSSSSRDARRNMEKAERTLVRFVLKLNDPPRAAGAGAGGAARPALQPRSATVELLASRTCIVQLVRVTGAVARTLCAAALVRWRVTVRVCGCAVFVCV